IPEGKKVVLTRKRDDGVLTRIPRNSIPMVLEENLALSISSRFSPSFGGFSGGLTQFINLGGQVASVLSGGRTGFGGAFKQFGMQLWESTEPLKFNLSLGFHMGSTDLFSAKEEVYIP